MNPRAALSRLLRAHWGQRLKNKSPPWEGGSAPFLSMQFRYRTQVNCRPATLCQRISCITCKFLQLHDMKRSASQIRNETIPSPRSFPHVCLRTRLNNTNIGPAPSERSFSARPRPTRSLFPQNNSHPPSAEAFPALPPQGRCFPRRGSGRESGGRGAAGALRSAAAPRRRSPSLLLPPSLGSSPALYTGAPHVIQADVSILLHRHTENISGNFHS